MCITYHVLLDGGAVRPRGLLYTFNNGFDHAICICLFICNSIGTVMSACRVPLQTRSGMLKSRFKKKQIAFHVSHIVIFSFSHTFRAHNVICVAYRVFVSHKTPSKTRFCNAIWPFKHTYLYRDLQFYVSHVMWKRGMITAFTKAPRVRASCGTLKCENAAICEKVAKCEKTINAKCENLRYMWKITLNVKKWGSLNVSNISTLNVLKSTLFVKIKF